MSTLNVQLGGIKTAISQTDNLNISVTNGRHFILKDAGQSLTMNQMVGAVEQFQKNGEDVRILKSKVTVLELQGKAKLANASLLTRIKAFFRKLCGNRSINDNLHLNKLDSLNSPLSDDHQKIAKNIQDCFEDLKSTDKKAFNTFNSISELMFTRSFLESLPCDSSTTLGKKREDLISKIKVQFKTLKNASKNVDLSDSFKEKMKVNENTLKDLSKEEKIAIVQQIGHKYPLFAFVMLSKLDLDLNMKELLEIMSQIKTFRSFELKAFKMAEYY